MIEKTAYKHLETDIEFRERVLKELGDAAKYWTFDLGIASGEFLDKLTWDVFKKQRRIVQVWP